MEAAHADAHGVGQHGASGSEEVQQAPHCNGATPAQPVSLPACSWLAHQP